MRPELAFAFTRVTEAAAIAGFQWLGRGDKNIADAAAVKAMREQLNHIDMAGTIVIGEGEIDEAPMLYIGEAVGSNVKGVAIDIAVDPIEGTRMTALGQGNAVAVLAGGPKGSLLGAPDMYMEKLVAAIPGVIDLNLPLEENIRALAKRLNKPLAEITLVTLVKPRHEQMIQQIHALGCRVFALPDGDVAASILVCMPESQVDIMYCIGGAPEGVISAAAIRALGGDMQGRLILRHEAKGNSEENQKMAAIEMQRCQEMGVTPGQILKLEDMAKNDQVFFVATGITQGDLLQGVTCEDVTCKGSTMTTETLLICGGDSTVRKIKTQHAFLGPR